MAHRSIGLDIGSSAVRAVELSATDSARPVIEAFGQVGLRTGAMEAGEIKDRGQVAVALRRLWQQGGFSNRQVHVGVAGLRAITREIDMPLLSPEELEHAVRFQADEVVPFPLELTALSSKVVAQINEPDAPPKLRVLVAAAHTQLIESLVETLEEADLEPVSIDLQTAALARALYDPRFGGAPETIASIGAGLTLVVVEQGGILQFVRTLDMGGETITNSVGGALDLPHADAEIVKRQLSYPGTHDPRAESAANAAVDELVSEIRNSIRFFSSLPGRQPVSRILLTGAGCRAPGFFAKLQASAGVPVAMGSPLSRVDTTNLALPPEQAAELDAVVATPIGLALPDPTGRPFNLLPASVTAKAAQARLRQRVLVSVAGLAVLLLALTGWRVLAIRHAQNVLSAVTTENTTIKTVEIPKYDKAVKLRSQAQGLAADVRPELVSEVDWLVVLNQLGQYIPSTATLSNVNMTATLVPGTSTAPASASTASPTAVAIATITTTVSTTSLPGVTLWGQSMSKSPIFTAVDLSGGVSNGSSVNFAATLSVEEGAHGQRVAEYSVPG
ncbi:MAG TPA: type IV pilus assembly protein PilM [Acidimicrobiales bacterium]|nr:type IV pilus assembly protein PilM [Acidimicrobiales bacterium]